MGKYRGQAGIVTGASGGIGRAICERLGGAGMELWLVGRSREELEITAAEIGKLGGPAAHVVALDIRAPDALADLVERVGRDHPYLSLLVNNAGVMHLEPIMSGRRDRWRAMFDINVLAPLEASRTAIEAMRQHGRPGHLINVGSLASRFDAGGVYGASKLAQEMISRTLRQELENDDIRVTSILPGGFVSKLARDLEPATIAHLTSIAKGKGVDFASPDNERFLGDPVHIADLVEFILDRPIAINLQEVIIRPPVSVPF